MGKGHDRQFIEETVLIMKHIKRCWTLLLIRRIQIKTALRYLCTTISLANVGMMDDITVGNYVEKWKLSFAVVGINVFIVHFGDQLGNS